MNIWNTFLLLQRHYSFLAFLASFFGLFPFFLPIEFFLIFKISIHFFLFSSVYLCLLLIQSLFLSPIPPLFYFCLLHYSYIFFSKIPSVSFSFTNSFFS